MFESHLFATIWPFFMSFDVELKFKILILIEDI